jgi:integrase
MLPSNGKKIKTVHNYHMTMRELIELVDYLKEKYSRHWHIVVLTQFGLGLRASEVLAIQIFDIDQEITKVDYRQAKTNKIIHDEPIPKWLQPILKEYISDNIQTFKDGYIFPKLKGKIAYYTTPVYSAFFSKWRKNLAKKTKNKAWVEKYEDYEGEGQVRYRIGSHSLRRLHRTVMLKKYPDHVHVVKELCHYQDLSSFMRYINTFEIREKAADFINGAFSDFVPDLHLNADQTRLSRF